MSQTRREFMKDAVCAGTVAAAGTAMSLKDSDASERSSSENDLRCPYFDQPMTCGGPDNNGKYKCDN